ncbi:hypothetical protein CGZ80_16715 [Rhodopirellula sp. MGV]|nr:hypothetical protein CGZ80_16715 [Rhodopirellula sp. MGV]PNY38321.1 hypothetical protein C2E31_03130 [Rhodopirellula baltica]
MPTTFHAFEERDCSQQVRIEFEIFCGFFLIRPRNFDSAPANGGTPLNLQTIRGTPNITSKQNQIRTDSFRVTENTSNTRSLVRINPLNQRPMTHRIGKRFR